MLSSFLFLLTACTASTENLEQELRKSELVTFHDRNGDGKVDIERHRFPGASDLDWELRDDNFDGTFEAQWHYGVSLTKVGVKRPVPTNVTISPE